MFLYVISVYGLFNPFLSSIVFFPSTSGHNFAHKNILILFSVHENTDEFILLKYAYEFDIIWILCKF